MDILLSDFMVSSLYLSTLFQVDIEKRCGGKKTSYKKGLLEKDFAEKASVYKRPQLIYQGCGAHFLYCPSDLLNYIVQIYLVMHHFVWLQRIAV